MVHSESLTDFELTLSADDVLRGQGADPNIIRHRRPKLVLAAEQALVLGAALLEPRAELVELPVLELKHEKLVLEGGRLSGSLIARQIGAAKFVDLVVCTVGDKIETTIKQLESSDIILAFALDGLANAAVDELSRQVCAQISERASSKGLKSSTPISPGAPEWPVETAQFEVFHLLGSQPAGVTLTSSAMMRPRKSASFVVGIGKEMSSTEPCDLCSLQDICRFRPRNK